MYYEDETIVIRDVTAVGHWVPPNVPNWVVLSLAGGVTALGILGVLAVNPLPLGFATVLFVAAGVAMLPGRLSVMRDAVRIALHPLARSFPISAIRGFQFSRPRLAPYDNYYVLIEGDDRPRFLFNSGTPGYEQILLHLLERTQLHSFEEVPRPAPRAWFMLALLVGCGTGVLTSTLFLMARWMAQSVPR